MVRLFAAIWPDADAVAALVADLDGDNGWRPAGWRATRPDSWHVTIRFHGEGDPGVVARELESRVSGTRAPRLRLTGLVTFPGVLAAGVRGATDDDDASLSELVSRTGGDPSRHRPHVTVALSSRPGRTSPRPQPLRDHRGPLWHATDVRLVRSELSSGPSRYTVLHRVPLVLDPTSDMPG